MLNKGFVLILFCFSLFIGETYAQKKKTTSFFFDTDISTLDDKQKEMFSQFVNEMDLPKSFPYRYLVIAMTGAEKAITIRFR